MAIIDLGKVSITWKGAYAGGTAYTPKDAVVYNNASYICIANTTGNLPTDTTYWNVMAAKGVDGTDLTSTLTTQGDVVYRDGSGLARLGFGTDGHVLTTKGTDANPIWAAAVGGKVLQVVSAFDNDLHDYSGTNVDNPVALDGMTVDITPAATTSKILLMGMTHLCGTNTFQYVSFFFKRDSTALGKGDASSWSGGTGAGEAFCVVNTGTSGTSRTETVIGNYLDSPSSTSQITYTMNGFGNNYSNSLQTVTLRMNASGYGYNNKEAVIASSNLIAMEIGA